MFDKIFWLLDQAERNHNWILEFCWEHGVKVEPKFPYYAYEYTWWEETWPFNERTYLPNYYYYLY